MIIKWDQIKEHREGYYVIYTPARPNMTIALLVLVFTDNTPTVEAAVSKVEEEFNLWIRRFEVPLMVMACDHKDRTIDFQKSRGGSYYSGYIDHGKVTAGWEKVHDDDFPKDQQEHVYQKEVYRDLNTFTEQDAQAAAREHKHIVRTGTWLVLLWGVVIPSIIAILGFLNIFFVGALALGYSLSKAFVEYLKLTGRWKKSDHQRQKDDDERKMEHHHYYCKLNPEGFWRLKNEVIEQEQIADVKTESEVTREHY